MFLKKQKMTIGLIVIVGVILGIFVLSQRGSAPIYDFVEAQRTTIVQEVLVTGNVKPVEKVNLAFEKIGTVSRILVDVGQTVKTGELLTQLSTEDAQKQVRAAEVDLESAKVSLEKARLEYAQLLRGDALNESYEGGLATLTDLYNEYEDILDNLDDIYFGSTLSSGGENNIQYYANTTKEFAGVALLDRLFSKVETLYQQSLLDYKSAKRGSGEARKQAIESGYNLVVHTAELIKVGRDTIRSFEQKILAGTAVHSKQSIIEDHIADLTSHNTTLNRYVADLLAVRNAINSEEDAKENYPLTIAEKELTVRQKENALQDAQNDLAKYSIRAPMDAVVARRDIQIGETVSANTPVVTIISEAEYEIEANVPEVDIARVQVENSAFVTLDAYGRDEVFEASVMKIDPAEVVIEGVSTYKVTLQFSQEDSRIRSGMTANVTIQGEKKENVLVIPQRAVIRENGKKFVRVLRDNATEEVEVETGLQGSDGNIEIVSGLKEGDKALTFFEENAQPGRNFPFH